MIPTSRTANWLPTNALPLMKYFPNFKTEAPSIVGIAKKKENSVETNRDVPKSIAPIMVAPDREVPGISERTWKQPMKKAIL